MPSEISIGRRRGFMNHLNEYFEKMHNHHENTAKYAEGLKEVGESIKDTATREQLQKVADNLQHQGAIKIVQEGHYNYFQTKKQEMTAPVEPGQPRLGSFDNMTNEQFEEMLPGIEEAIDNIQSDPAELLKHDATYLSQQDQTNILLKQISEQAKTNGALVGKIQDFQTKFRLPSLDAAAITPVQILPRRAMGLHDAIIPNLLKSYGIECEKDWHKQWIQSEDKDNFIKNMVQNEELSEETIQKLQNITKQAAQHLDNFKQAAMIINNVIQISGKEIAYFTPENVETMKSDISKKLQELQELLPEAFASFSDLNEFAESPTPVDEIARLTQLSDAGAFHQLKDLDEQIKNIKKQHKEFTDTLPQEKEAIKNDLYKLKQVAPKKYKEMFGNKEETIAKYLQSNGPKTNEEMAKIKDLHTEITNSISEVKGKLSRFEKLKMRTIKNRDNLKVEDFANQTVTDNLMYESHKQAEAIARKKVPMSERLQQRKDILDSANAALIDARMDVYPTSGEKASREILQSPYGNLQEALKDIQDNIKDIEIYINDIKKKERAIDIARGGNGSSTPLADKLQQDFMPTLALRAPSTIDFTSDPGTDYSANDLLYIPRAEEDASKVSANLASIIEADRTITQTLSEIEQAKTETASTPAAEAQEAAAEDPSLSITAANQNVAKKEHTEPATQKTSKDYLKGLLEDYDKDELFAKEDIDLRKKHKSREELFGPSSPDDGFEVTSSKKEAAHDVQPATQEPPARERSNTTVSEFESPEMPKNMNQPEPAKKDDLQKESKRQTIYDVVMRHGRSSDVEKTANPRKSNRMSLANLIQHLKNKTNPAAKKEHQQHDKPPTIEELQQAMTDDMDKRTKEFEKANPNAATDTEPTQESPELDVTGDDGPSRSGPGGMGN